MAETPDRRTVILDKAAGLFASKGIAATTVREIAEAVGILSGSLYHHFTSKDDMVDAIVRTYLDDLVSVYTEIVAQESDPRKQLTALVHGSLSVIEAHPHATEIYQNSGNYLSSLVGYEHIKINAAKVQKTWLDVIGNGVVTGVFRDDIPPRVLYRLIRDALWLSVRWFKPTHQYSMKKFADDLVSTFLDGIVPR
ncbi:TetR/AcrR family transcriptional regulator [Nakamurella silvestris]|nr:TetR/AcrR family transcriptional regulator [Nakamurella silvestris]